MAKPRRVGLIAFLGSFAVYLIPLIGPHFVAPAGVLVARFFSGGDRSLAVGEIATLLILQAAAGALLFWFVRRPGWLRVGALAAAALVLVVAANWLLMVAVPSYFLIGRDTAPEQVAWPEACSAEGWLDPARSPQDSSLARAGQAVIRTQGQAFGMLTMPGCRVTPIGFRFGESSNLSFVVAGGSALVFSYKRGEKQEWQVWPAGARNSVPIGDVLPGLDGTPILSNDGRWIAEVQRQPPTGAGSPTLVVRPVPGHSGEQVTTPLDRLGRGSYMPLALDMSAREAILARNSREFLGITLDGQVLWGPLSHEGLQPGPTTFLRIADGWVIWDGYRDDGPYRFAWSLRGTTAQREVVRGRGITSLAASPDGRWIAVSVTGQYSIGSVRDAVYVVRASDGQEMFRRYLPRYARSVVAFLGDRHFAYSHDGRVFVLDLPE